MYEHFDQQLRAAMNRGDYARAARAEHDKLVAIDAEGRRRSSSYYPTAPAKPRSPRELAQAHLHLLEADACALEAEARSDLGDSPAATRYREAEGRARRLRIEIAQRDQADAEARDRAMAPAPVTAPAVPMTPEEARRLQVETMRQRNPVAAAAFADRLADEGLDPYAQNATAFLSPDSRNRTERHTR